MIESLKNRLWQMLMEKEVSLAMIYDGEGNILWHRGRKIKGRTVAQATGFPKSEIEKTIEDHAPLIKDHVVVLSQHDALPKSARMLYLRSMLIQPISDRFFLYVDSGVKEAFSDTDREVFQVLGTLLGDVLEHIRSRQRDIGGITGESHIIADIRDRVLAFALEEEPISLTGETGVGKSHLAELIHRYSGRSGKFVTIHAPSIPETLFEGELFGHRRGSFTDAHRDRLGLVDVARGGTLFFDEIAEIPLSVQAKLLQLIDTGRFRTLGDAHDRSAEVRIISATNRDLQEEIKNKRFREDLFFRLNVLPVEIPPLRSRPEDIRPLVAEFSHLLRGKRPNSAFFDVLEAHAWPGNVRELITVLKRVGIQRDGPEVGAEVVDLLGGVGSGWHEEVEDPDAEIRAEIAGGASFWDTAWRRFIDRDLSRRDLKRLLASWHRERSGTLKDLATFLHIEPKDYPRFVSALHKYEIHPAK